MAEEPKPLSSELRSLREQFTQLAESSKKAIGQLDQAIFKAETAERRAANDAVLEEFTPGKKTAIAGHDFSILVNKSQDMGAGYDSPIGATLSAVLKMTVAAGGYDTVISAATWDAGAPKHLNLGRGDALDKARDKSTTNQQDLLGTAKEIMIANTPDKPSARTKHYIVVSRGSVSDNVEHTVQMIETTLRMNPKATFDFINIDGAGGNIEKLVRLIDVPAGAKAPAVHDAKSAADIWPVLTAVVKNRLAETPAAEAAAQALPASKPDAQGPNA